MSDITTPLFIDGQAVSPSAFYDIFNPARPSQLVGRAASASHDDVDSAIRAADKAQKSWAALSLEERASYLLKIADNLNADEDEATARKRLFTTEHGKTLFETNIEITRLADRFRQVANFAAKLPEAEQINGPVFDTLVTRKSRGVSLLIVPWNWPLAILGSKLPQALLAGNCVVIKLSEMATLAPAKTIIKIAEMLPAGVVNLITGDGAVLGDRMVSHPLVRQVNFTGSIPIGRHVMKLAAENLTPVTLELGGNDAGLVLADAQLTAEMLKKLYISVFLTSGQICMALKRLYVHRSLFDDVVDGLTQIINQQVIGDGLQDGVTLGPLNNLKQKRIVEAMLAEADSANAEIRYGGQVPDQALFDQGYFLRPSLVINPEPHLSIVRDEQFGPSLPIIPFDSDDDAIAMANDSDYGLSSSVWSSDDAHALAVAQQLEVGFTNLNAHGPTAMDGLSPFGGVKQSGIGRNFGREGIMQFQEIHSISGNAGSLF